MSNKVTVLSKKDAQVLEETRKKIIDYKRNITKSYINLARLLAYVSEAAVAGKPIYIHWGYNTFANYCEEELNMTVRKAEMLIVIARFVDQKILTDPHYKDKEEYVLSEIDQIGWAKAYLLPKVVISPKDFSRWAETAKKMNKEDFRKLVTGNSIKSGDDEDGKPARWKSYTFKVVESGVEVVETVFDHIRRVNGENIISGPMGDGLVLIRLCQHYMSNLKDDSYSIEGIVTSVMDTYNIDEVVLKYSNGETKTISRASASKEGESDGNKD